MLAMVQNDGEFSDPFPIIFNTVQHDVFCMLTDAVQDGESGIPIRYRFDGKRFNLRRLQAKSKVQQAGAR